MLDQVPDSPPEQEPLSGAELVHVYARPGATCTVADDRGVCIELHVKVASGDAFVASAMGDRLRRGARVSGRVLRRRGRADDGVRGRGHRADRRRPRRRPAAADRDGGARRRAARPAPRLRRRRPPDPRPRPSRPRPTRAWRRGASATSRARASRSCATGASLGGREPRPALRGRGRRHDPLPHPGAARRARRLRPHPVRLAGSSRSARSTSSGSTASATAAGCASRPKAEEAAEELPLRQLLAEGRRQGGVRRLFGRA